MLTILGLMASAGSLYLATQLLDISIWAMNFALMFALALGIDYALLIVMRFRGALFGSHEPVEDAVAETMDTAGKAVLLPPGQAARANRAKCEVWPGHLGGSCTAGPA
jgi:RND superfamily putative drug exporter